MRRQECIVFGGYFFQVREATRTEAFVWHACDTWKALQMAGKRPLFLLVCFYRRNRCHFRNWTPDCETSFMWVVFCYLVAHIGSKMVQNQLKRRIPTNSWLGLPLTPINEGFDGESMWANPPGGGHGATCAGRRGWHSAPESRHARADSRMGLGAAGALAA